MTKDEKWDGRNINGRNDSTPGILILSLGHKIRLQVRFCEHEIRKNVKIPQVYYP